MPEDTKEEILEEWGWPKEPFEPEDLMEYVKEATKTTKQEAYAAAVAEKNRAENEYVHLNKVFASVCVNQDGTGDEISMSDHGIDPNAFKAGKWYSFLNANEDCWVYVHNYTRNVTATKPPNFKELTEAEKKRLKALGTYIKELPNKIEKVYLKQKSIPLILASQETCDALKKFFVYDAYGELCDTTRLKRMNAKALEECRIAIVNAMKFGKWLCVYLGDHICDFQGKVCVSKNKNTFPDAVFRYGALEANAVKELIYREEDRESGQCVVRPGFKVCLVVMYDSINFDMSSFGKEQLRNVPYLDHMEEVRTYNADDKKKFLNLTM
eukprot:gnl/MRDRNA2_/MRDRNA2_34662_c0_seq1.p1 gnl/MRDRNA2_/MRDRNA2_34662_c0~~gnl/MRDRNA2_/MRDRNA2_34662_c0_seq1.p1  ORF type:complete len:361 (+),score=72.08 gnl/MRDRNA2_/MRDRNA2_34662_c0_seq1:109-1083(+)